MAGFKPVQTATAHLCKATTRHKTQSEWINAFQWYRIRNTCIKGKFRKFDTIPLRFTGSESTRFDQTDWKTENDRTPFSATDPTMTEEILRKYTTGHPGVALQRLRNWRGDIRKISGMRFMGCSLFSYWIGCRSDSVGVFTCARDYTGYTQKNGAVSKVNKKFISPLTQAQHTPSAAATVQVSHALPAVRFSCLLRGQFPRWRRSRKRLSVCSVLRCPDLWLQCTKLTLHCNHRSGHLKTEYIESLFLLRRHLGNWPRSKHEKRTAGSAWETWTVAAADGVRCVRVRWEINFLLTFETAPFFCVYSV